MDNKKNITVILPILSDNIKHNDFDRFFDKAIQSIKNNTVQPDMLLIVKGKGSEPLNGLTKKLNDFDFGNLNVNIIENKGNTSFQGQLNFGVSNVTTEFFTWMEFDDEISKTWILNAQEYIKHHTDVDIFLPIIHDITPNGQFLGNTNEAAWAYDFSEEMGIIDHNILLQYMNISPNGMVMRKETYEEVGGLKTKLRLSFNYEFLLRVTYKNKRIMVIPKMGYLHTNGRENSLFWSYKYDEKLKLEQEEGRFWLEKAKSEFYFTDDREITYDAVNLK